MEQETLDIELPRCGENKVGIIVGGVFNSGITATGAVAGAKYNYREPTAEEILKVQRIDAACKRHGVSMVSAALQFPLAHPLVASIIPGAFTPDHVRMNLDNVMRPIPSALWAEIKAKKLLREDAPVPSDPSSV